MNIFENHKKNKNETMQNSQKHGKPIKPMKICKKQQTLLNTIKNDENK